MCADHGVVKEGVTQTDSAVTKIVTDSFQYADTTVTVMAKSAGVDVFPVDVGMNCEDYFNTELVPFCVAGRKIRRGTGNIVIENAMTRDECVSAVITGVNAVGELKEKGYNLIATGEMGIGNTTASSALCGAVLDINPDIVTGKGAGLSKEGFERKKQVVSRVIERVRKEYEEDDFIGILSACGGLEIAAICGIFIGGAIYRVPCIADGFISCCSALLAERIVPQCADFILGSHVSAEPAGKILAEAAGLDTYLDCGMCLGEGTGAVAAIPLLKMAVDVYNKMSTFDDFKMESYVDFE